MRSKGTVHIEPFPCHTFLYNVVATCILGIPQALWALCSFKSVQNNLAYSAAGRISSKLDPFLVVASWFPSISKGADSAIDGAYLTSFDCSTPRQIERGLGKVANLLPSHYPQRETIDVIAFRSMYQMC